MNCAECRERLVEADRADLEGIGDSPLAAHLTDCTGCRAIADRLLEEETRLREALDALQPVRSAEEAVRRAARIARRRRRRWLGLVPAAAAAGIAALLLSRSDGPTVSDFVERAPPTPIVESSDQNVVIYQTDNPDIVVVWLYLKNGSGT